MAQFSTALGTDICGRCGRPFTLGEVCVVVAGRLKRCVDCAKAEGYDVQAAEVTPADLETRHAGFERVGAVGETVKRYWWEHER